MNQRIGSALSQIIATSFWLHHNLVMVHEGLRKAKYLLVEPFL